MDSILSLKSDIIHIVFDRYFIDKDLTRPSKSRAKSNTRKYVSSLTQVLPSTVEDWQCFLSNDANKCQLVRLIIDYILSDEFNANRPIFVTKDDKCIMKGVDGSHKVELLKKKNQNH